jgi:hypothetical protein
VRIFRSLLLIIIICIQFSASFLLNIIQHTNYYYNQYSINYANNFTELSIPLDNWKKSNKKELVVNGNYYDIKSFKVNKNGTVTVIAKLDEFDNIIGFIKKELGHKKDNNTSTSNDVRIKIYAPAWFDKSKIDCLKPSAPLTYLYWFFSFYFPDSYCKEIFNPPKV